MNDENQPIGVRKSVPLEPPTPPMHSILNDNNQPIDASERERISRLLSGSVTDPGEIEQIEALLMAQPGFKALVDALIGVDESQFPSDEFQARTRLLGCSRLGRLVPPPSIPELLLGDEIETNLEWVDSEQQLLSVPLTIKWLGDGRFQLQADWPPAMTPLSLIRFIGMELEHGRTASLCDYQPPQQSTHSVQLADQNQLAPHGQVFRTVSADTPRNNRSWSTPPKNQDFAFPEPKRDPQQIVGKLPKGYDEDCVVAELIDVEKNVTQRPPTILTLKRQGNRGVASFAWNWGPSPVPSVKVRLRPLEQKDLVWLSIEQARWLFSKEFAAWPLMPQEQPNDKQKLISCGQNITADTVDEGEWFVRFSLADGAENA